MIRRWNKPWAVLAAANVVFFCVLGLYQNSSAQQGRVNVPFPIPEEQRGEMINLLTDIRDLIKEQNALLRSSTRKSTVPSRKR